MAIVLYHKDGDFACIYWQFQDGLLNFGCNYLASATPLLTGPAVAAGRSADCWVASVLYHNVVISAVLRGGCKLSWAFELWV